MGEGIFRQPDDEPGDCDHAEEKRNSRSYGHPCQGLFREPLFHNPQRTAPCSTQPTREIPVLLKEIPGSAKTGVPLALRMLAGSGAGKTVSNLSAGRRDGETVEPLCLSHYMPAIGANKIAGEVAPGILFKHEMTGMVIFVRHDFNLLQRFVSSI